MTPEDVYQLVDERTARTHMLLLVVGLALCILVALQITAKLVIWRKVVMLLREVKILVRAAEIHGGMTDRETSRVESLVSQAKEVASNVPKQPERILEAVAKVPDEVIAKLKDSSESGILLPKK